MAKNHSDKPVNLSMEKRTDNNEVQDGPNNNNHNNNQFHKPK
jgi:hypothetical protein